MRRVIFGLTSATCLLVAGNSIACDVVVGEPAFDVVSKSAVIFWGIPIEARLLGDNEQRSENQTLAESYNGKVVFEVEFAVKGAAKGDLVTSYFSAEGTSCDMPVTVGQDGFYFLREQEGDYYWGQYTQPYWFEACEEYLDVFEAEFGVEFPLLRARAETCRSEVN